MKLGAEPKKIAVFAGLILLAAVVHFTGGDDRPKSTGKSSAVTPAAPPPVQTPPVSGSAGPRTVTPASAKGQAGRPNSKNRTSQEYKPILRPRRVEDRIDPTSIDPTLRTDLLTQLDKVPIQGGNRPLFDFSTAPPPKAPDPGKIIPQPGTAKPPVTISPIKPPTPGSVDAPKPQAPPIPLKFYGFTSPRRGVKRAFFLEGEDVFVANEGDLVKKRYKVVRVNLNSVLMEDTEYKQQQTLPLTEQSQQ
ncbi:MAG: hypothetical protein HYX27_21340 [Acidobacteria bacterium]|nr:hypothetical protein [Acidobacteriota bacterium]